MSRVGRKPISIPEKVEVGIDKGKIKVKGPQGELEREIPSALRLMTSPLYLIPVPLYGSGFLKALISAAISPTFCLSHPKILKEVGLSSSTFVSSGGIYLTMWEYPKLRHKVLSSKLAL